MTNQLFANVVEHEGKIEIMVSCSITVTHIMRTFVTSSVRKHQASTERRVAVQTAEERVVAQTTERRVALHTTERQVAVHHRRQRFHTLKAIVRSI